MRSNTKSVAFLVLAGALFAAPADAQFFGHSHHHRHHRHHYGPAQPDGSGEPYGYRDATYPQAFGGYYGAAGWEAAANARATAQAYRDPGLALELEPDAKQTATGGPVGGLPGRK